MKTLPLSEVKMKLSKLVDEVESKDEEITITRNGKPAAILLSADEFESLKETSSISSNSEFMDEIKKGLKGLKNAKLYTLEELFKD